MLRVALVLLLVTPAIASAHLGLTSPPSRYGPDELKYGPCGITGGVRSTNVAVYEPGQTIEIVFDEYVDHPGHYRIAFDPDGDDDFADPVCLTNCDDNRQPPPTWEPDTTGTVLMDLLPDNAGGEYRFNVTLPNVECENCTLQVIQVMYDKRPYTIGGNDNYYQCVDLALRVGGAPPPDAGPLQPDGGPPPDGGLLPDGGPLPDGGVPDTGPGNPPAPTTGAAHRPVSQDCSASGSTTGLIPMLALLLFRRRRS